MAVEISIKITTIGELMAFVSIVQGKNLDEEGIKVLIQSLTKASTALQTAVDTNKGV